jgi:arylsulfatase A-like enzyme
MRVRAVQAVDRMIGDIEQTLRETGQAKNTIFVFSSDNGFHIGEYGLYPGKLTAFDTDVVVPLVVVGPHIPAGTTNSAVVQNVDLAPTFEQIGGAEVPADVDGHSLVPLLLGKHPPWRSAALIEHHGGDFTGDDPDQQIALAGNPSTYEALRTADYTYVAYADGQREYYDRRTDPWELHNVYDTLSASRIAELNAQVRLMSVCHGGQECWNAAQSELSD